MDINITNNMGINLEKIPDLDISRDGLKDINEILIDDKKEKNIQKEKDYINNKDNININNINTKKEIIPKNNKEIIKQEKEKDPLIEKLLMDPKYIPKKNLLTPITNNSKHPSNQSSSNIKNDNQNIDLLKKGLNPNPKKISFYSDNPSKYPKGHKIILKDDKNYGKYIDINSQTKLPIENKKGIKRPESKGVFLPQISNNLNMSTTTLSNDTNSLYSQMTGGKNMKKINKKYYIDIIK